MIKQYLLILFGVNFGIVWYLNGSMWKKNYWLIWIDMRDKIKISDLVWLWISSLDNWICLHVKFYLLYFFFCECKG